MKFFIEITLQLILKESSLYRFSVSNGQSFFLSKKLGTFLSVVKLTAV